jgi:hypothetical protein
VCSNGGGVRESLRRDPLSRVRGSRLVIAIAIAGLGWTGRETASEVPVRTCGQSRPLVLLMRPLGDGSNYCPRHLAILFSGVVVEERVKAQRFKKQLWTWVQIKQSQCHKVP